MKTLSTLLIGLFLFSQAEAKTKSKPRQLSKNINVEQQVDTLGSNEDIIEKAKTLQPNNSMKIVQKRQVDRNLRPEIGLSYGFVNGGDTYLNTRNWGANFDFHINPRWSLGLRYNDNKNELTSEGKRIADVALAKQNAGATDYVVPEIAFPIRSYMGMISWYPIYGKISWFESAVSQFDFYLTAGGGQVQTKNVLGQTNTSAIYTGGMGMGLWVNSWLTSRVEVRYQNYQDRVTSGTRNIDSIIMQIGIGIML